MYSKKKPEDLDCGIEVSMKIFGGKWKPCLIDFINKGGSLRPSEIHRAIPTATPRVLNMQLRELESYNVVSKKIYPGLPPKVEYSLTEFGKTILPIIAMLDRWGIQHKDHVKKADETMKVLRAIR
ncbi:winged helix-turn-helix transcriptional regulator [Pseudochryseolinea flava]|uniref:Transcriptional regulator n=1 Tax=Pseudochryseolinea flava TaxID=2059302 RepID=A0A364Y757_9BACT|nr:helix-turn-helix domain-containing protein [Pseudochryseolinea flava]RAW02901.1 transcriptional regulator [Pseudochryseolinea flava]